MRRRVRSAWRTQKRVNAKIQLNLNYARENFLIGFSLSRHHSAHFHLRCGSKLKINRMFNQLRKSPSAFFTKSCQLSWRDPISQLFQIVIKPKFLPPLCKWIFLTQVSELSQWSSKLTSHASKHFRVGESSLARLSGFSRLLISSVKAGSNNLRSTWTVPHIVLLSRTCQIILVPVHFTPKTFHPTDTSTQF